MKFLKARELHPELELIRCPFCGGAAVVERGHTGDGVYVATGHRCTGCGARRECYFGSDESKWRKS